jgi:hypothetical protein
MFKTIVFLLFDHKMLGVSNEIKLVYQMGNESDSKIELVEIFDYFCAKLAWLHSSRDRTEVS